jgi:hypothetical protein
LPQEILEVERFIELSENASYCVTKRVKNTVKLKLRTKSTLYTLKVDPAKSEDVIRKLKCDVRLGPQT